KHDRRLADHHGHRAVLDQIGGASRDVPGHDLGVGMHALGLLSGTDRKDARDGVDIIGVWIFQQPVACLFLSVVDRDVAGIGVADEIGLALVSGGFKPSKRSLFHSEPGGPGRVMTVAPGFCLQMNSASILPTPGSFCITASDTFGELIGVPTMITLVP